MNQDQTIDAYIRARGLEGAENLPFNELPFRQVVVTLRYLQAHLGVHHQGYPVPSSSELLYAVDTLALFVNHALNDPECWCNDCEHRRIGEIGNEPAAAKGPSS